MKQKLRKLILIFLCFLMCILEIHAVGLKPNNLEIKSSNIIPIAMATDNNYVYPTLVAMASMLENKSSDTTLKYYIMVSGDMTQSNRDRFKKLEECYQGCSVELIDMKNNFSEAHICGDRITSPTYYRLNLPNLLPQHDKILYLDGDILVRKDLSKLYNTDISDYYIGAVKDFGQIIWKLRDDLKDYAQRLSVRDMEQLINAGVLVMNLKLMREDKMEQKFSDLVPHLEERKILLNDQDVLNSTCFDKIKFVSPEFNAMQHFEFYFDSMPVLADCYNSQDWKIACTDPTIVHYTAGKKPWINSGCRFCSEWDKCRNIVEEKCYKKAIPNVTYKIISGLDSKKSIDINKASRENNANVQLWQSNGTNAQKFNLKYIQGGCYEIEVLCSKKVLDVAGAGKTSGTNVWQHERNGTDAQKWILEDAGNGYYYIISKCNGFCLDVSGANTQDGTNIQVWDFNGSNAQKFKLVK